MRQTSRQTGHFVFTGFLANHSFKESLSNTWKQVVTAAVIGEMSSVVIEQDSLFLQASSAIIQAMRRGIGFRCVRICMGGAREGEGEGEREGEVNTDGMTPEEARVAKALAAKDKRKTRETDIQEKRNTKYSTNPDADVNLDDL